MTTFNSTTSPNLSLYIPVLGVHVQFVAGVYETLDARVEAWLSHSRYAVKVGGTTRPQRAVVIAAEDDDSDGDIVVSDAASPSGFSLKPPAAGGAGVILPFAGLFDYVEGQAMTWQGQTYTANTDFTTTSTFDEADWTALPVGVALEYLGTWNASTNSPTLADGTGVEGTFRRVATAGTRNLGSGSQTFAVNDSVQYDGGVWTKVATAA